MLCLVVVPLAVLTKLIDAEKRITRSAAISSLSEETSNILGELIAAINPVYLVIIAVFVAAGCAFEVAYASRGAANSRSTHVASRNGPYSVRSI